MSGELERPAFVVDTALRESRHLGLTDEWLFALPFTVERAMALSGRHFLHSRTRSGWRES